MKVTEGLLEISKVWKDMNDIDKAALLEIIAGKTRSNTAAAILSNTTDLENAYVDALNAEGSALRENEEYMNSIQGRIDQYNNSVQTMWSNTINSDAVKGFVDFGKTLVETVDNIGLIKVALSSLIIFLNKTYKGFSMFNLFGGKAKVKKELEIEKKKLNELYSKRNDINENISSMSSGNTDCSSPEDQKAITELNKSLQETQKEIDISQKKITKMTDVLKTSTEKWKSFGKSIGTTVATLAESATYMILLNSVMTLIQKTIDSFKKDTKSIQENFEELNNELSDCKSELQSLKSKFDDTQDKIKTIMSAGPLTFVQQEELDKLRAISVELKNQIALQETLQETLSKQAGSSAIKAYEDYTKNTSFKSENSKTERVENAGETGKAVGGVFGSITGIVAAGAVSAGASALGTKIGGTVGTAIAGPIGTAVGAAIGLGIAAIGSKIGSSLGKKKEEIDYSNEESVSKAFNNMQATLYNFKKDKEEKQKLYYQNRTEEEKIAYEEASKALSDYDDAMSKHISKIQEYVNAVDYSSLTTEEEKNQYKDMVDDITKYNIVMGANEAKQNALERIFGAEATETIKKAKEEYIKALNDKNQISLEKAFIKVGDGAAFEELKQRLYDMGIYVVDAENYLIDFKEAEEELAETNLYDLASSMETTEDAISSLKSAFEEVTESGQISAKTIKELYNTFGSIDGISDKWKNYVNIMMSGTASTKKMTDATRELIEAWVDNKLTNGALTEEDKVSTAAMLTRMGVTNANKYIDDAQKEAALNAATNALKKDDDADLSTIATEYGVENDLLQENIGLLKEKAKLEKDIEKIDSNNAAKAEEATLKAQLEEEKNKYTEKKKYTTRQGEQVYTGSDYYDQNGNKISKEEVDSYNAKIKELEDKIKAITIDPTLESDPDKPQKQVDNLQNKIDTELTLDVQMDFNPQDPSKLVDDIQSVFDTLKSAQKEYNENGYLTVDTMQTLLELNPKYLDLLYDENGQLNLNEKTLYDVAMARITDLEIKSKAAILEEAERNAKKGSIDVLRLQTEALYGEAEAYDLLIEKRLDSIKTIIEERQKKGELVGFDTNAYIQNLKNQLNAVTYTANAAKKDLKNTLSSSGNTAKADASDALEKLKKKYERQISNMDNQQTYLQNEVDRLKAENKGVSKSYYDKQIEIEERKLGVYQKERNELLALMSQTAKGTDEWYDMADAIWDVEHNIQNSTKALVEFRQEIINLYKEAFDNIKTAFDNKDALFEDRQNYIDKYNELLGLQGKSGTESSIKKQLADEYRQMRDNEDELKTLKQTLSDALQFGGLKEGSEEWVAMEADIRAVEAAILDNQIAIENYKQSIIDLYTETFGKINQAFGNKDSFLSDQQSYIEGYAEYLETLNVDVPTEVYNKLIEIEQEKRENNLANLEDARAHLEDLTNQGLDASSEEWIDAKNKCVELEKAIQDNDIAMAKWNKTIQEMDFTKFDDFMSRLSDLESEISNIKDLMSDKDVAFEDGTWTKEGLTSIAMYYQQMEMAQQKTEQYKNEIEELNALYEDGQISERDYYDRLKALQDGQWDSVKAYESAKDAIVDLNKSRVDMIERGVNKEIEAMSELIDMKKKELDAERD